MTARIGCPCGCRPADGEDCITDKPAPTGSHCPCSTLEIGQLCKREAVRWHIAGHPAYGGAA